MRTSYPSNRGRIFQSTLPTRGSDHAVQDVVGAGIYFNPRSPRGGATVTVTKLDKVATTFQSTLPTRGSDPMDIAAGVLGLNISIHAPHEGERP